MIRYNYHTLFQPPAPFVYVQHRNPVTDIAQDVPAQLDTAADRTLLPDTSQALALRQIGTITVGGVAGITQTMPRFLVNVRIHNFPDQTVEVASVGEAWVLPGRDVLNSHLLVLDGPQSIIEIG